MANPEFDPESRMALPPDEFIRMLAHDARALAALVTGWADLIDDGTSAQQWEIEGTEYTVSDAMRLMQDAANKLIAQLNVVTPYIEDYKRKHPNGGQ